MVFLAMLATVSSTRVARAQDADACVAASEQAVALRSANKLIESRASLSTCAASSCPELVRASCQQRMDEANRAIPSLVFVVKDSGGRDVPSVRVTIDGTAFADHLDGSAMAANPGEHEFRFEAEGYKAVVKRLVLHQGEQSRREDVIIGAAGASPGMASTPTGEGPANDGSTQRTLGLIAGGVGVGGLVAGGIFGALSMSTHSSYQRNCGSNIGAPAGACNAAGLSGISDAQTKGNLSTAFFIGGGVLAAAGALLFFTAPHASPEAQVGVGPRGVWVEGRF